MRKIAILITFLSILSCKQDLSDKTKADLSKTKSFEKYSIEQFYKNTRF